MYTKEDLIKVAKRVSYITAAYEAHGDKLDIDKTIEEFIIELDLSGRCCDIEYYNNAMTKLDEAKEYMFAVSMDSDEYHPRLEAVRKLNDEIHHHRRFGNVIGDLDDTLKALEAGDTHSEYVKE